MVLLILFLYLIGAVAFWISHKSESLKEDFLMGVAWPFVVPVTASLSTYRRILGALEERRTRRVHEQGRHESELRAQEQRFIGYAAKGTAKWMIDEVPDEEDDKRA